MVHEPQRMAEGAGVMTTAIKYSVRLRRVGRWKSPGEPRRPGSQDLPMHSPTGIVTLDEDVPAELELPEAVHWS